MQRLHFKTEHGNIGQGEAMLTMSESLLTQTAIAMPVILHRDPEKLMKKRDPKGHHFEG